jgi:hypothetical protein
MNVLKKSRRFLTAIATATLFFILTLFSLPSLAQVSSEVIPRIEIIESQSGVPPAYRLVISQPQDNVYVFCPSDFEPELNYRRNVKAIECKPL